MPRLLPFDPVAICFQRIYINRRDGVKRISYLTLGVLTIHPNVSMINLLDHCVRSPSAASLILGQEVDQDVIEVTVGNPAFHGLALRDLALPVDTLIVSIRRHGHILVSHGYTRLELGDAVTIVGSPESLEEVQWQFDSFYYA